MKWTEDFSDLARRMIGTRNIPLSYVIRDTVDVPRDAPALMPNQPYDDEYELVEEEIIDRATHTHPSTVMIMLPSTSTWRKQPAPICTQARCSRTVDA